ncbi:hypothetical protein NECID01_2018 [Nematocida sp. AWRm77]|nr:hypothetical protein NECID01_2018 [Nematocida sp. AWRm77]
MPEKESEEEDDLYKEEKESTARYTKSLSVYEHALSLEKPNSFLKVFKIPGIVLFSCMSGYILGRGGYTPLVLIPLLYTIAYVFYRRIGEFKKGVEAFIYFSIRKQTVSKYEQVNWMNEIMEKTWRYVESSVSKILLLRVNAILRKIKLPMINDIKLEEFTLGGQPPVIEGIRIRHSDKESLIMDVSMHFMPTMADDQKNVFELAGIEGRETDWNSNITLVARVGGSTAGFDIPFTLKNVSFRGNVRIKLFLTYDSTVVEGVEFSFLKQPLVGFNIVPLKTVDIMDIPGLATAIKKVIEMGVAKEALYPKKISVSLKPKSIYYVGVLVVHVHKLKASVDGEAVLEIGLNGRRGHKTQTVYDQNCNLVAYIPIKNMDETVTVFLKKPNETNALAIGSLGIEQVCMMSRVQSFVSLTNNLGYLDVSASYFPKLDVEKIPEEEMPKSAIVTAKLIQLIDMVDVVGQPYKSLHVRVTAYLKEKRTPGRDPSNMSAAELMGAQGQSPAQSATNGSSTDSEEDVQEETSSPVQIDEVLGVFTTSIARNTVSPAFDESFVFYTRDTKRTTLTVEAFDKTRLLGTFTVNVKRGIGISYGTFDFWRLNTGRAKLAFSAEYVYMTRVKMQKYQYIRSVCFEYVNRPGVYSGYIVTQGRIVQVPPFFSEGSGAQHAKVYVPVLSEDEISKFIMYYHNEVFGGCELVSGETYVGDTLIKMSYKDIPIQRSDGEYSRTESMESSVESTPRVPHSTESLQKQEQKQEQEQGSVIAEAESDTLEPNESEEETEKNKSEGSDAQDKPAVANERNEPDELVASDPDSDSASTSASVSVAETSTKTETTTTEASEHCSFIQMRVIVCRVNHPIFLEFTKDDIVLDRSAPSSGKKLPGEFFFFTETNISVYTVKEGFLIGRFILSKTSGRHEIKLAHGQLFVVDVYNRWFCSYSPMYLQSGDLSFSISEMTVNDLPDMEIFSNVFVEVAIKDKAYVTTPNQDIERPAFSERFVFSVFRPLDLLDFRVYGWTLMKEKKLLGEYTLPVSAIPPGESSLVLPIQGTYADAIKTVYNTTCAIYLS